MTDSRLVRHLLEHRDDILSFLIVLTQDRDTAEEIFQDVGLAVVEEANRNVQVGQFLPWVREIARHRTADYYRRKTKLKIAKHLPDSMASVVHQAFDENEIAPAENRLREKYLEECLEQLSGKMKEAIEYRYRERMPLGRMASTLALTAGSVKVVLFRARKALLNCVQRKIRTVEAT